MNPCRTSATTTVRYRSGSLHKRKTTGTTPTLSVVRGVVLVRAVMMIVVRDRIIDRDSVRVTIVARADRLRGDLAVRGRSLAGVTIVAPMGLHPVDHAAHVRKWGVATIADGVDRRHEGRKTNSARRVVGK